MIAFSHTKDERQVGQEVPFFSPIGYDGYDGRISLLF